MHDLNNFYLQLQILIDDSARLQANYPGENAEQIEQLQATVVENWGVLQDRAAQRKEELMAAADLHRFNASVNKIIFLHFLYNLQGK